MTYTTTIKIAEFAEISDFLYASTTEESRSMIELIESQTFAKQNKFWKFHDSRKVGA